MGVEAEIGRILMPRGDAVGTGFFDEEGSIVDQNVGTNQILDCVENSGMPRQFGGPRKPYVELAGVYRRRRRERCPKFGLIGFERGPVIRRFHGCQRGLRR